MKEGMGFELPPPVDSELPAEFAQNQREIIERLSPSQNTLSTASISVLEYVFFIHFSRFLRGQICHWRNVCKHLTVVLPSVFRNEFSTSPSKCRVWKA